MARRADRRLIILGSTGSIGRNTLNVVRHLRESNVTRFEVVGLATGQSVKQVMAQAAEFGVQHIAVASTDAPCEAEGATVFRGADAAEELVRTVTQPGDLVVAAMVGSAGLPAIIAAIERGCDVALANKETLVAAGAIVMPLVHDRGIDLLPIDSEHSAVFQCLQAGRSPDEIERVVLTASGGPFRAWSAEQIANATIEQALNHPTWDMGEKVTIDSATLMNKALEVIEAHWLFDLGADRIDAIIHPQSMVHSFVEFIDGSVVAHLNPPDMRSPIQYALTWPHRERGCADRMDWAAFRELVFEPVDHDRFPAIRAAHSAIRRGGSAGATLNAANELAVEAFLSGRVSFDAITDVVEKTVAHADHRDVRTLDDVFRADADARALADQYIQEATKPPAAASVS